MNLNETQPQTLLINLDLFFDFYSVLFSAYRTHFAKQAISISSLRHLIEGKSLDDGLNSLINEISPGLNIQQVKEELLPLLDISLASIKPIISVYALLKDLTKNGVAVKTFTTFEDYVIKHIKEAHKDWFNYEIIQIKDNQSIKDLIGYSAGTNTVFINSSIEACLNAKKEEGVRTVFMPHSKSVLEKLQKDDKLKETLELSGIQFCEALENIDWNKLGVPITIKYPEPNYYLKLDTKPSNTEYQIWTNVSKLKEPIELTSEIVHGFGRGGKKLGIPTANLDMTPEIESKLENLVSGVYYGWAEFLPSSSEENPKEVLDYDRKQPMVMSIGFNPYFNNKYKTAEAHIMQKFEGDFYESTLRVKILGFIRTEADFIKFPHLIEAIHNDVQVAKDILNAE
jgi:riboflavin kinase